MLAYNRMTKLGNGKRGVTGVAGVGWVGRGSQD